jgi:hypothetical protein
MWEGIIAVALIAAAFVWVGWSIYRSATGKGGCGCGPRCQTKRQCHRQEDEADDQA